MVKIEEVHMDATNFEANRRFSALVASLPVRDQVVGSMADGTPVVAQVHSLFGGSQ